MADSEGTAEIESPVSDIVASGAATRAADGADAGDVEVDDGAVGDETSETAEESVESEEEEEKAAEPPRRRLVAELLEGEVPTDELPDSGSQLVAPPLHAESVDTGQPIYQLDLSADEPQGVILAAEPFGDPDAMASVPLPPQHPDPYGAAAPAHSGAHQAVKGLIVDRERRVMVAERDGIGAYDLAVELDEFVRTLVDAVRRIDD